MLKLNPFFTTLLDLLPDTQNAGGASVEPSRAPCTHARLRRFIAEEVDFWKSASKAGPDAWRSSSQVAELAVAFVAVLTRCVRAAQPGEHAAGDRRAS